MHEGNSTGRDETIDAEMRRNRHQWDRLGREDPMWAILTVEEKRGNRWEVDEFFQAGENNAASILAEIRDLRPDFRINSGIDFGCGIGRMTQAFASRAESMTGIDVSASMIERANTHNRFPAKCTYLLNEASDLSRFTDESFDFVFSLIVLQHIPVALSAGFIREFVRVLRPGGIGYFNLPELDEPRLSVEGDPWGFDMYGIRKETVRELLEGAGASVLDCAPDGWCGPEIPSYRYIFTK